MPKKLLIVFAASAFVGFTSTGHAERGPHRAERGGVPEGEARSGFLDLRVSLPPWPVLAVAQQPAAIQKLATTGNAALGKQLYLDYSCWACHGYNAQTGNGARLLPPRFNERLFTLYLRAPRTPQMPAYSVRVMGDADAANIYAYILSLPREPQIRDVPVLNQLPK